MANNLSQCVLANQASFRHTMIMCRWAFMQMIHMPQVVLEFFELLQCFTQHKLAASS